jgi:phenylacetate 2-hydroxylase
MFSESFARVVLKSSQYSMATDIAHIKGIPEIPGATPFVGHLLKLGEDHATTCEKWWKE